jgi:PqqD family protein of HPr-rel-A system
MAEGMESTWLWFADRSHFCIHDMGEVSYLYCMRSGDTHVFNTVSMAILEYFAEKPHSIADLIEDFPELMGLSREECPRGVVRRMFNELDEAGLVMPLEAAP